MNTSPIFVENEVRNISDLTGRQVESWEVAYFNGAAILDEIPVANRDQTDQVVFRDGNPVRNSTGKVRKTEKGISWHNINLTGINTNKSNKTKNNIKCHIFVYSLKLSDVDRYKFL